MVLWCHHYTCLSSTPSIYFPKPAICHITKGHLGNSHLRWPYALGLGLLASMDSAVVSISEADSVVSLAALITIPITIFVTLPRAYTDLLRQQLSLCLTKSHIP